MEKHGSQGFDRGLVQSGEKTAQRRTRREPITPEERHEHGCPRMKLFVKAFQRPFGAYGIAKKHRKKIDQLVMPKTTTSKEHLFFKSRQHALTL